MNSRGTHENFERFLKDSADELELRPTAGVWNRIESRMNRRRRWVYLTSGFFLLSASVFGYLIVDHAKQPTDPFAGLHTIQKQPVSKTVTSNQSIAGNTASGTTTRTERKAQLFQNPIPGAAPASTLAPSQQLAAVTTTEKQFEPIPVDELEPAVASAAQATTTAKQRTASNILSIESVVNLYKPRASRKSEFQVFFTPTVSYRRLTENKSYLRTVPQNLASYNTAALYDVNSMVTHKPDLGLELGFALKYPVTRAVKLRTGLQFNITRYSIRAFTYGVPERTTITLNNRARGLDSVNTISSYRNGTGGRVDWLQNFYFQASAPVGVEVALNAAHKTRFGFATTIQPTYVVGDRAYLLSTDYKNYTEVPWMIRRWNVNTSVETFVSYSSGKLRWQLGPQVRYQLLSSFIQQYPVKENLFDFGMKLGVSLDKK